MLQTVVLIEFSETTDSKGNSFVYDSLTLFRKSVALS